MEAPLAAPRPMFTSRALRRLIVPLILEQLLAMMVGMTDTVMITTVGESAVSGISLVDSFNNLIIYMLAALCTGGAVVCAQYLGRQESANARRAAGQLLYVTVFLSLVITALILPFRRFFLGLLFGRIAPDVMGSAALYLLLTAMSYPFLAAYNTCAALFRAMGNSRVSLYVSLLMNVLHIAGNAYLIYGLGWGVAGAGVTTLVSRVLAAALMLLLIRNNANPIYLRKLHRVRLEPKTVRSILAIGIPSGVENGFFNFGKIIITSLIATLGTAALAANAIVNSISSVLIVPGSAMNLTVIMVVGQCVGAGDYDQAGRYTRRLMLLTYALMGIVNLPVLFLAGRIAGWFNLSPEAVAITAVLLPWIALAHMVLWPLSFTLPNALRAAGDMRFTMTVTILSVWLVRVGLSYVFVSMLRLGVPGIWYSMFCDWVVRIALFVSRYVGGKWKLKRVI